MKNNRYKEALDELNVTLDEQELMNRVLNKRKRNHYYIFAIAMILVIGILSSSALFSRTIDLTQSTGHVKVKLMGSKFENISTSASLIYLSENELFADWVTDSFYGEVKNIENIEMKIDDAVDYRAIITFEILDPIKTSEGNNQEVTILLPNQIASDIKQSESDFSSQLTLGTRAVILANRYGESSIYQVNESILYLQELATFGLPDGIRFCMLENPDGTFHYTPDVFTSLADGKNYFDIKNHIIKMME